MKREFRGAQVGFARLMGSVLNEDTTKLFGTCRRGREKFPTIGRIRRTKGYVWAGKKKEICGKQLREGKNLCCRNGRFGGGDEHSHLVILYWGE